MDTLSALPETLPAALTQIRTRPLLTMKLAVRPILDLGETPLTTRRVGIVYGGIFRGERLSGAVLDGGNDWQSVRRDGCTLLDVRLNLKTEDGALIGVIYKGLRHGPADVMARLGRGEDVAPEDYYFRINPMFETASEKYGWLNNILAIGTGHRFADGPVYNLFEVL
jgi:hypothetical protein